MSIDTRLRWAASHGAIGAILRRNARHGALDAQLHTEPARLENPFPTYDQIRESGPFYVGTLGYYSAWHSVCLQVLRSDDFGVQGDPTRRPPVARAAYALAHYKPSKNAMEPPSLFGVDPPVHTRYRRALARALTPRVVEALRPEVEQMADVLLDELGDQHPDEPLDLVSAYNIRLPVAVISRILGVPPEMRDQFVDWGDVGGAQLDFGISHAQFVAAERALTELYSWMLEHVHRVRRQPGEDLLSRVVVAQKDADADDKLTDDEIVFIGILLLLAGFETTVNMLSNGAMQLMKHPDQLALLLADPELWPNAVQEVLRIDSPVQCRVRYARRDIEIEGVRLPMGTLVMTMPGAANRDPAVFPDPDRFDVRRPEAREHLAFGGGVHYCIGAALGRMEGEVGLQRLFERYPGLQVAGPAQRRHTRTLRGYAQLPVRLKG